MDAQTLFRAKQADGTPAAPVGHGNSRTAAFIVLAAFAFNANATPDRFQGEYSQIAGYMTGAEAHHY